MYDRNFFIKRATEQNQISTTSLLNYLPRTTDL